MKHEVDVAHSDPAEAKVTDPVCGMAFVQADAAGRLEFDGAPLESTTRPTTRPYGPWASSRLAAAIRTAVTEKSRYPNNRCKRLITKLSCSPIRSAHTWHLRVNWPTPSPTERLYAKSIAPVHFAYGPKTRSR